MTDKNSSMSMGNFKELLKLRVSAGDKVLEHHLNKCAKNATHVSKTSQNEFLLCIKENSQNTIVSEIKEQDEGPYYGIQVDEVTDSSTWEQLGLVVRYWSKDGKPVERLLEFIACEEITGEAICDNVIRALTEAGLDPKMCRSQTMDGAGNMSGKNAGFAARFSRESPRAIYHYCSSHNLNLVLCKSCQVKDVTIMLDTLKGLGIFFKYSPKRSRRLEKAIEETQESTDGTKQKKKKFKVFCETRWVEKHTCLDDFEDSISQQERCLDGKAIVEANGLLKKITDPCFIFTFTVVHHFFGYFSGLSKKLQGSTIDIEQAYGLVDTVKEAVCGARNDESIFERVFETASTMAKAANLTTLEPARQCSRQTQRNNVPSSSPKEYFKRALFLPFIDAIISQVNLRFSSLSKQVVRG